MCAAKTPAHYLSDGEPLPTIDAVSDEKDEKKYAVYKRRFFVAGSLAVGYAMWNWTGNRHVILAKSYAKYYDQPFEQQLFTTGRPGIDFLTIFGNAVLLVSYLPSAYLVDRCGLRMMWLGSGALCLASWVWYISGPDINGAIFSIMIGNGFGPLLSTSLLAVSNKWFPEAERGKATAFVTLMSIGGAGLSVLGPTFLGIETSPEKIDLDLRSCNPSNATLNTNFTFCSDFPQAVNDFCCVADANLPFYDLVLALLTTASFIFTVLSVRDRPPIPPSEGATAPNLPKFLPGFKHIFSWPEHMNFIFIMLADFLVGGPPKVIFATISRILPATVAELDVIATAVAFVLVPPFAVGISHLLDTKKLYYPIVAGAFSFGFVMYICLLICLLADTVAGDYAFLILLIGAVIAVLAWQVGVFELKLEYVFTEKFSVEGLVIGTDRFNVNLASAVFVSFLAPEIVGRINVFIIGGSIMAVGLIPLFTMKGKYAYQRLAYERRTGIDISPERIIPIKTTNTS